MSYMDEVEETSDLDADDAFGDVDAGEWAIAARMQIEEFSHYLGEGETDDEVMEVAREALGSEPYDWREHVDEFLDSDEEDAVDYVPVMDEHEGLMVLGFANPDNPDDCFFPGEGSDSFDLDDDELF